VTNGNYAYSNEDAYSRVFSLTHHIEKLEVCLQRGSRQCCGSGIQCLFDPGPGFGIRNRFFSGSRIPTPYFLELSDKFLGKKFYNSMKTGPNFFLQHLKNKIIFNFVKFVATKKGLITNFFSPLSFVAVFGSGIRDPGSGIQDKHPVSATLVLGHIFGRL
jgi:hypothetical protein